MNQRSFSPSRRQGAWRQRLVQALPVAALALAVLAGCGGGGSEESASAGTSGTSTTANASTYTVGTVSGFGSIVVNGVRFDDSAATVVDDSDQVRTISSLKLGMRVSVDSGAVDTTSATAKASKVRFGSAVVGPVSAVDTTAGTLTVLGQTVDVTSATVFDDTLAAGLSAVTADSVVEVHGLPDTATGHLVATRIESAASATAYKLRGTVAALDTTAKTFTIGAAKVSYAAVTSVPSDLADGQTVRVLLSTTAVDGVWQATALSNGSTKITDTATTVQVRGKITAFTSATAFTVDGLVVDATNASFPDGTTALALGTAVEVKGTVSNGVLVATQVEVESRHSGDDSRKMQLHGSITSVDTTAKTFVVRGVTVDYSSSTLTWTDGTEANLVVGAKVRVLGTVGTTRTQVLATNIRFTS